MEVHFLGVRPYGYVDLQSKAGIGLLATEAPIVSKQANISPRGLDGDQGSSACIQTRDTLNIPGSQTIRIP